MAVDCTGSSPNDLPFAIADALGGDVLFGSHRAIRKANNPARAGLSSRHLCAKALASEVMGSRIAEVAVRSGSDHAVRVRAATRAARRGVALNVLIDAVRGNRIAI